MKRARCGRSRFGLQLSALAAAGVVLVAAAFAYARADSSDQQDGQASNSLQRLQADRLPQPLRRSSGRAYVVASNGSDRNPGTRQRPLRTVQEALDRLSPGQRVLVRRG